MAPGLAVGPEFGSGISPPTSIDIVYSLSDRFSSATRIPFVCWKLHYDGEIPGKEQPVRGDFVCNVPGHWQN
ncbi:hypothetical protein EMGR_000629 [Emarellia grisea]